MAVLNHKKPDRAPLDLCNSASYINDTGYFNLKNYLNIEGEGIKISYGYKPHYDERVLEALKLILGIFG